MEARDICNKVIPINGAPLMRMKDKLSLFAWVVGSVVT